MSFFINETIKEKIKKNLPNDILEYNTESCLYFFQIVQNLIEMNYSLVSSIELNKEDLQKRIQPTILKSLKDALAKSTSDHD